MLNRRSAVPLHHQFKRMLLNQIASGALPPGARLLTEREYAEQLGISLAPIRQALSDLAQQGYLERYKSRGTFVRERKIEQKITALSSFTDSMHQTGLPVELEVLRLERCRPSAAVAARLWPGGAKDVGAPTRGARPTAMQVVALQRRCTVKGEPAALLFSYLPAARFPGLERRDLTNRSLYHLLEEEYGCVMSRAESYIEVRPADDETAALLTVQGGAPLLCVDSVTWGSHVTSPGTSWVMGAQRLREGKGVAEELVEYAEVLYRADRYRFLVESRREPGGVITPICP